jgi:hypothetical protein
MHFVFSYNIAGAKEEVIRLKKEIDKIIKPNRWANRLTDFYIVESESQANWESILKQFQDLSNNSPAKFHFIMSPLMSGGRYNGILPQGSWEFVNKITSGEK